ncbi:MAG: transcription antitermination factor NusB [Candidatus Schekmanbacteria bacterium]|nr:transcription antitermination factor NusB [Candidatus Schekmanbacteria bacterium]
MGLRREAREYTLQFLHKFDAAKTLPDRKTIESELKAFWKSFSPNFYKEGKEFSERLIWSVFDHRERIDSFIEGCLKNWKIGRLAAIDRNIIRIAIAEFLYFDDIDFNVTINEAIEISKKYGMEKSPQFINGVLDRLKGIVEKEEGIKKQCQM